MAKAGERQRIGISYMLAPARPLPESVKAVAVIDAGVQSDEERRDARERKWQQIAADMIESMVQSGSNATNGDLTYGALKVVDRRATRQILAEKDMQLVGIVEGEPAAAAGKLLAVDGLIMSRIKISIDYKRSRKSNVDWGGLLGGQRSGPPPGYRSGYHRGPNNPYARRPAQPRSNPGIPRKTIEEISRDLTVQCSFTLIDANTGEAIVRHTPPVYQKRDKAEPQFMFGGAVQASDLDPVDHFTGELVERASREFVSMISPVRVTYSYPLELRGKEVEQAVRMLRGDDFYGAIQVLERAYQKKPKESDYLFAIGLVSEMMCEPGRALDTYRRTVSLEKVDKDQIDIYMSAKERLSAHIDRIIPNQSKQPCGGLIAQGDKKGDKNRDRDGKRSRKGDDDDNDDDDDDDDDDKDDDDDDDDD
ncbi:MAG: hypothetical protein IPK83_04565 [Planctomycetes bacterium]|nr:hypothetical protein [Planctomycetota bacterium]